MALMDDEQLSRQLLDLGLVSQAQLEQAKMMKSQTGVRLDLTLMQLGALTAADLARIQAQVPRAQAPPAGVQAPPPPPMGVPPASTASVVSLSSYEIDPAALRDIPRSVAEEHLVLPIQMSDERVVVAMADATNVFAMDEVRTRTGRKVEPVQVPEDELRQAIEQLYAAQARTRLLEPGEEVRDATASIRDLESATGVDESLIAMLDQAPVVRIVHNILSNAVRMRASDVHAEPREDGLHIRYRIDGQLVTASVLPKDMMKLITSRLKIMADIDIGESRLPQDNRAMIRVDDRPIDLRVSTLPTYWGEKVVLRILDKAHVLLSLNQLGFTSETLKTFQSLLRTPQGMILVTGPTGSGKSTTLYGSLQYLRTDTKNITTVEDPIEYQVEGINQSQVLPKIDLSFARCLRAILRQDPDIILVGEIRDTETAEMAFRAALTGHLVLSTLHTNDAPSAVTRLVDMKIEPYLIASSVIGVLAQRLVRRICTRCREQTQLSDVEIEQLGLTPEMASRLAPFKGRGCEQCRNTGYYGRIAVYEVFAINNELRHLVMAGASAADIRRKAVETGMTTLRDDGLQKIHAGVTTASEIISVIYTTEVDY
jgi:type IV pilus assembly protein PilB